MSKIAVTFQLKNRDYSYIHLEDPAKTIAALVNPGEIVIPMSKIEINIDYPLKTPTIVTLESDSGEGFSRAELARKISDEYKRIYDEEEQIAGVTGCIPGMFNRATSDGPYGIYGHDLGDLDLIEVTQIEDNLFELSVDS